MEIKNFFLPVSIEKDLKTEKITGDSWIRNVAIYDREFPDYSSRKIAVIGIISEENPYEANKIRNRLYSLKKGEYASIVSDLGNFEVSNEDIRCYERLGYILSELQSKEILPVLIGSTQQATYSQYLSYEYMKKLANLVSIDPVIDLDSSETGKLTKENYLYKILLRDPSWLFNYSQLGYQTYMTDTESINSLEQYYFDTYRLGRIREDIQEIEPVIRNADILSFDVSSIRRSDAPGSYNPSPNGFTAEEACLICRFAGLSDNLRSLGFHEYNSADDEAGQTAFLISQMIWYFVDGFLQRQNEISSGLTSNFTRYITSDSNNTFKISFLKSLKTNRWWMEVPVNDNTKSFNGKEIVPCSYRDYENATRGGIPERWFKAWKKMEK